MRTVAVSVSVGPIQNAPITYATAKSYAVVAYRGEAGTVQPTEQGTSGQKDHDGACRRGENPCSSHEASDSSHPRPAVLYKLPAHLGQAEAPPGIDDHHKGWPKRQCLGRLNPPNATVPNSAAANSR